ncbi:peptidoglycan-binding protein LysM [Patiriisocius marinus]|uniref:peptidoglycan-binding protein LysM n=1 Tax=Patiriisocius marinus TaxID=1397112 RepID=UPI00232EB030|nr:peptidoglycan-binding protein LysM [Patiriisocius marinus]
MGLFSFIKNAGAKVFGIGKTTEEEAAEAKMEAAEVAKANDQRAGQRLINHINDLDLGIEDLFVSIEGERATINGTAKTQEAAEKAILIVGNTAGIAEVSDEITVEEEVPVAVFHTVVSGDSLSKIAKKVYGDAMKYPVIFEANKPMLEHPDKIYPGQVLRIPNLD